MLTKIFVHKNKKKRRYALSTKLCPFRFRLVIALMK